MGDEVTFSPPAKIMVLTPSSRGQVTVHRTSAINLSSLCLTKRKDQPSGWSFLFGAGDEARTRYLHLGKVALYRMSYTRIGNMVYYSAFFENVKGYFCFFDKKLRNALPEGSDPAVRLPIRMGHRGTAGAPQPAKLPEPGRRDASCGLRRCCTATGHRDHSGRGSGYPRHGSGYSPP